MVLAPQKRGRGRIRPTFFSLSLLDEKKEAKELLFLGGRETKSPNEDAAPKLSLQGKCPYKSCETKRSLSIEWQGTIFSWNLSQDEVCVRRRFFPRRKTSFSSLKKRQSDAFVFWAGSYFSGRCLRRRQRSKITRLPFTSKKRGKHIAYIMLHVYSTGSYVLLNQEASRALHSPSILLQHISKSLAAVLLLVGAVAITRREVADPLSSR